MRERERAALCQAFLDWCLDASATLRYAATKFNTTAVS